MRAEDQTLLKRLRDHRDEAAFRALYRSHTPRLYALAMRLTGGAGADAEEIVQEAWVRAVERLDRFEGRSSLRTWLSGIVVNCYRELLRRRARGPRPLDEGLESRAVLRLAVSKERPRADAVDVERALARLPPGYREVVILHDLNGHTHREIAGLLGIAEGTSKSQLARGHARLRDLLTGTGASPQDDQQRGPT